MTRFLAQALADSIYSVVTVPFELSLGSETDVATLKLALEERGCSVTRSDVMPMTLIIAPPPDRMAA